VGLLLHAPNLLLHLPPFVELKVHFHDDIFISQVPRPTQYAELVGRVGRKIHFYEFRGDDDSLRVEYMGDIIPLASTEDLKWLSRNIVPVQITLFVT